MSCEQGSNQQAEGNNVRCGKCADGPYFKLPTVLKLIGLVMIILLALDHWPH